MGHDSLIGPAAGLLEESDNLERRFWIPARVEADGAPELLLHCGAGRDRLLLEVVERPRAADLADDAALGRGEVHAAVDQLPGHEGGHLLLGGFQNVLILGSHDVVA